MKYPSFSQPARSAVGAAALLLCLGAYAQEGASAKNKEEAAPATLEAVTVSASADASAQGLAKSWAGGQVARGARVGLLGTQDVMDTPFSITSYTSELIADKQARSVGEVLQNDPGVRVARGFGNFQESYFIRGFILGSDDTAYNGLYGLLPRQYISADLFERVELLRGASAFLSGAAPSGGGIGGTLNLLPKRAPNQPLTRLEARAASGGEGRLALDVARRFGPDQSTGIRLNLARRQGGTAIDDEKAELGLAMLGLDWRSSRTRLSADIGWQDNRLKRTRTNVTLAAGATHVPLAPEGKHNFAQPWTYSNERDTFGTLRAEHDFGDTLTAWAAAGYRSGDEANSLANLTVTNAATGAGAVYRFDNAREDRIGTGELGLRGKLRTGGIGHEWVASASAYSGRRDNAYRMDYGNTLATNLYRPSAHPLPALSASAYSGGVMSDPRLTGRVRLASIAVGDTLSLLDERLRITLGLRHQKLHVQDFAYTSARLTSDYKHSRTSPVLGALYKVTPGLSVYANYIEGLSQGQTAPRTARNAGQMLRPYVSKQKEIGLKYEQGGLGMSAALFSTSQPRSLLTADNVFTAQGRNRHQGLELTVYGQPVRGLRLLGGAAWLDAKQQTTGSASTDGKRVIGVPRLQANLGADWDVPGISGLAIEGRLIHTGATYANAANTLRAPGWTRLDAGVRYIMEAGGHMLTLRLRADNLTNRRHWASVGGYPGNGYLVAAAPRSFSLSASIDF